MTASVLRALPAGSHVCLVVDDADAFDELAGATVESAVAADEKAFYFGPRGSFDFAAAGPTAHVVADPFRDFLDEGPLIPETMFARFREEARAARDDGFLGVRVFADMDWLLPAIRSSAEAAAFELLLDRALRKLGTATVVCAYRSASFDRDALDSVASVHPINWGFDPLCRVVAQDGGWAVSGEVDFSTTSFAPAVTAAVWSDQPVLDLAGLRFMDCHGMRILATAIAERPDVAQVRNVPAQLQRLWSIAGFEAVASLAVAGDAVTS